MKKHIWLPTLLLFLTMTGAAGARVELVALPERAETIIRLDNPKATLIEEERVLTLQQGLNRVDFSWQGVSIAPDSIRLTALTHPGQVTLINVSFPPAGDSLVWEINSPEPWEEKVRISYLLSAIDRVIAYKLLADKEEKKADLNSYLVLRNFSGEDFDHAKVLLDYGQAFERGLAHEETKQLLFLKAAQVPIEKVWTFDAARLPWDPEKVQGNVGIPVKYRFENGTAAGLGSFALWGGKVRVYQDDGRQGTIVLGEDRAGLVAVGEKMEVGIGDSRDLVVTQRKMSEKKVNVRRNKDNETVLFDSDEVITAKVENFKDKPAILTMIQHLAGQWEMKECNLKFERKDASTLEFQVDLPAKGKKELTMHYVRRNVRPGN